MCLVFQIFGRLDTLLWIMFVVVRVWMGSGSDGMLFCELCLLWLGLGVEFAGDLGRCFDNGCPRQGDFEDGYV